MNANSLVPMVIENDGRGERSFDLYSALMKERTIFLNGAVDNHSAAIINAQLFYLNYQSEDKPIHFYINSGGGECYSGLGIYSVMQKIKAPVYTYSLGLSASMASVLLMAGAPGFRYGSKESTIMIHQVAQHGGSGGKLNDMQVNVEEMQRLNDLLTSRYVEHCGFKGKDFAFFKEKMRQDCWLTSEQAIEIGLIDKIA
jgi:ATP-dependent Clp protease protease subunit